MTDPVNNTVTPFVFPAFVATAEKTVAEQKVDFAFNKLSLSNVRALWDEKVGNVSFFAKIPGLISYLWNKSTADELDKAQIVDINIFNTKLAEFVTALKDRGFTTSEAQAAGVEKVRYNGGAQQVTDGNFNLVAKEKEEAFYKAFTKRCTQIGVNQNSDDFIVFATAATGGLTKNAQSRNDIEHKANMKLKIKTVSLSFNGKVYDDMIKAYANQPVAQITPQNFKQKVAELKALYPNNEVHMIEASLRRAISSAANKTAMGQLAADHLVAGLNTKATAFKGPLEIALKAQLLEINNRMHELCGHNRDGAIKAAVDNTNRVKGELAAANVEFIRLYKIAFPSEVTTDIGRLVALDLTASPELVTAKAEQLAKTAAVKVAEDAQKALEDELAKLAVWTQNVTNPNQWDITGGTHAEVSTKLNNLDATAIAQATNFGNVFNELCTDVAPGQEAVRSAALKVLLDLA